MNKPSAALFIFLQLLSSLTFVFIVEVQVIIVTVVLRERRTERTREQGEEVERRFAIEVTNVPLSSNRVWLQLLV